MISCHGQALDDAPLGVGGVVRAGVRRGGHAGLGVVVLTENVEEPVRGVPLPRLD